jgi:hypothetical protein
MRMWWASAIGTESDTIPSVRSHLTLLVWLMSASGQKRTNHLGLKSTFVRCCPKADKC